MLYDITVYSSGIVDTLQDSEIISPTFDLGQQFLLLSDNTISKDIRLEKWKNKEGIYKNGITVITILLWKIIFLCNF